MVDKTLAAPELVYLAAMGDRAVRMAVVARRRNARRPLGRPKSGRPSTRTPSVSAISLAEAYYRTHPLPPVKTVTPMPSIAELTGLPSRC